MSDSPLRRARLKLRLSLTQLAAATSFSKGLLSQVETGQRTAPPALLTFLGTRLGLEHVAELGAAQAKWRATTHPRKSKPTLVLEVALPEGISEEQAREACVEALAEIGVGRGVTPATSG